MATFPESPVPQYPFILDPEFKTLVTDLDGAGEDRIQKNSYPLYNANARYETLTQAEMQILYNFFMARCGMAEAFYFYDVVNMDHVGQYCGTADGGTQIFDIPGKSTSAQAVYLEGIEQIETTDYVILTEGGASNADRIDFVSDPGVGKIVTLDFTGYLRGRGRFAVDRLPRELFTVALFTYGLPIKGLPAA